MWTLTYSVNGKRCVEFIPEELVTVLRPLAEKGRAYKEAVHEVLTINAELVTLWKKQKAGRKPPR